MKALYTMIDNKVFKIEQSTAVPNDVIIKRAGINVNVSDDKSQRTASMAITINTLNPSNLKSNRELYDEFVSFMKKRCITETLPIQNMFKIYIDYSIMDNDKELEHSSIIKPIDVRDLITPLGVNQENELVYRRVKQLETNISFKGRCCVPHGIMEKKPSRYKFRVHNICIFQCLYNKEDDHASIYGLPHTIGSHTINSCLDDCVIIMSTLNDGVVINDYDIPFEPRLITLDIDILLSDFVVVYNDLSIKKIINDNLAIKYPSETEEPTEPSNDDEGCGCDNCNKPSIPSCDHNHNHECCKDDNKVIPEKYPIADGSFEPDAEGNYDWYERCTMSTPDALLVVEDNIPNCSYKNDEMIRKYMVIADIPDIEIGEYVIYREGTVYNGFN